MHLVADQAEVEVERKREASRFHGSSYDLVKIRGELRLRSRLDKTATVEVTKQLSGDVSETVPTDVVWPSPAPTWPRGPRSSAAPYM